MLLKDQAVIVTGGASGLGAATARKLAAQGAKVAMFDLNAKLAETVAAELKGVAVTCDVSDATRPKPRSRRRPRRMDPRACWSTAPASARQRVVGSEGPMPLDDFDKVITVNLIGTFNMLRLAATEMSKSSPATASAASSSTPLGRRLRRPDRPGGLFGLEGRHRRHDAADRARVRAVRRPRDDDRAGHVPDAAARQPAAGSQESLSAAIPFPPRLGHADEFAALALTSSRIRYLNGEEMRLDGAMRMAPK